jgi:hypothetical protein
LWLPIKVVYPNDAADKSKYEAYARVTAANPILQSLVEAVTRLPIADVKIRLTAPDAPPTFLVLDWFAELYLEPESATDLGGLRRRKPRPFDPLVRHGIIATWIPGEHIGAKRIAEGDGLDHLLAVETIPDLRLREHPDLLKLHSSNPGEDHDVTPVQLFVDWDDYKGHRWFETAARTRWFEANHGGLRRYQEKPPSKGMLAAFAWTRDKDNSRFASLWTGRRAWQACNGARQENMV